MEALEAIKTRRSIRKFKPLEVPKEIQRELLDAAMLAPSAGNEQPWQFLVIDDRKILEKIPLICPTAAMCRQSPLAILVCGDRNFEKYPDFWVQDCSASTQNILLAAHALGLGAVWAGVYPMKERVEGFIKMFALPEEITPFSLIALGYPDEEPAPARRFREERVHYNGW